MADYVPKQLRDIEGIREALEALFANTYDTLCQASLMFRGCWL